jgi:hypothetical protein
MQPTQVSLGSVWMTKTKRHLGHLRKIVGFNKNQTMVRVVEYTKKHRQHTKSIYSIPTDTFVREHQHMKD